MRKFLGLLIILLFANGVWANGVVHTRGEITELYFEDMGFWTIEITFTHINTYYDSALCIYSSTDSAFLDFLPSQAGIVLINYTDLTSPFSIDRNGDSLYILVYPYDNYGPEWVTREKFVYGDHPGSKVNAPSPGQSLLGLPDQNENFVLPIVVKDTSPSLGYEKDPVRGTLKGHVYDSTGIPMPYQLMHLQGLIDRTIWTDENGYFEDSTVFGMNYEIFIRNQDNSKLFSAFYTVEPDSITEVEIILPIDAMVEINGRIILENQSYYEGCYAIFTSYCPDGPIDTFLTDNEGYYSADIIAGSYYIRWSKENYIPEFAIPSFVFHEDATMGYFMLEEGNVHEIERGTYDDQWENDYPYYIFGDISIESGDTLSIDSGCEIVFCGGYWLNVMGTFLAEGTVEDTILLTRHATLTGFWKGIQMIGQEANNSEISYCKIVGPKYFNVINAAPEIHNNHLLWVNELSISDACTPLFSFNKIEGRICCRDDSSPKFLNNYFSYPGSCPFELYDSTSPIINYNTFHHFWFAFDPRSSETSVLLEGNIFSAGGLFCPYYGHPPPDAEVKYNLFHEAWGYYTNIPGFGLLTTTNYNGDSCDIYYNLFMDPLLVDPENGDFHLQASSPAIDAGDPNSPYDPDNTIADMGAYYFDQLGIYVKDPSPMESKYEMVVIPNPNDGNFSISIKSPEVHHYEANLSIHSINGNLVETRNIAFLERGANRVSFSGIGKNQNLVDGIYVCTLRINGRIITSTKLIISE